MRQPPEKKFPVLEPSTFLLEEFNANEWITVFRREWKKIARSSHRQSSIRRWPDNAIVYSRRKKKVTNLSGTYVIHGHKALITAPKVFSGKPNHKEFGPKNLASFVGTRPTLPVVRGILGFRSVRSFSICQSRSPKDSSRPTRGIMAGRGSRPPPIPAAGGGPQFQQGGQRPPAPRAPQPFDAPPPRGGGGG
jgi:hypothetical protein